MLEAIHSVRNDEMSLRKAADVFGVHRRVTGQLK